MNNFRSITTEDYKFGGKGEGTVWFRFPSHTFGFISSLNIEGNAKLFVGNPDFCEKFLELPNVDENDPMKQKYSKGILILQGQAFGFISNGEFNANLKIMISRPADLEKEQAA
jgi:hypothetical protein